MEARRAENEQRWEAAHALEKEKIEVMKELFKAMRQE